MEAVLPHCVKNGTKKIISKPGLDQPGRAAAESPQMLDDMGWSSLTSCRDSTGAQITDAVRDAGGTIPRLVRICSRLRQHHFRRSFIWIQLDLVEALQRGVADIVITGRVQESVVNS